MIGAPKAYGSPEPFATVFQPLNSKPARLMFVVLGTVPAVPDVINMDASLPVPPLALKESREVPAGWV